MNKQKFLGLQIKRVQIQVDKTNIQHVFVLIVKSINDKSINDKLNPYAWCNSRVFIGLAAWYMTHYVMLYKYGKRIRLIILGRFYFYSILVLYDFGGVFNKTVIPLLL